MALLHERDLRGKAKTGWLNSSHSFSFGNFYDPNRMGYRALRVINEDHVIPGAGFPTHGHEAMDIVTIVLSGALAHKDSLGTGSVIKPGDIQRMFAGSGITHSEMNASQDEPVHFLQIWIEPERGDGDPSYQQITINDADVRSKFGLIAGPDTGDDQNTADDMVSLHSNTKIYMARLNDGDEIDTMIVDGRGAFMQLVKGEISVGSEKMVAGDGLQIDGPKDIQVSAIADSEILLFNLA